MLTLEKLIDNDLSRKDKWLLKLEKSESGRKFSNNFRSFHLKLGVQAVSSQDFVAAKNNFFICGLIEEFQITNYNNRLFDYGLPHICYVLLSDHEELIQRYVKLRYAAHGQIPDMDTLVLKGESAIWCNTVQLFMESNTEGIERNLNILETITLKKLPKNQELLKIDYAFYQALLDKDKGKCEELLEELLSPKVHKRRNDIAVLAQYVSQPALGYAKLAWRHGVEVEVNSPLVPKTLLPIQPNEHYEVPYDFLK